MIILKLVGRYAFSKTNRHRNVVLLIMLAIAIGSFALIVMLSLMNNLQSGILNQIKALESFHIQLSPFEPEIDEITSLKEVESSFAFITTQSLLQAPSSNCSKIMRLRFLDPKIFATQNPFISQLKILEGSI
ncbi:MAG: ABC transporter permease, partial [Sphaerochaetaceae bacterium]